MCAQGSCKRRWSVDIPRWYLYCLVWNNDHEDYLWYAVLSNQMVSLWIPIVSWQAQNLFLSLDWLGLSLVTKSKRPVVQNTPESSPIWRSNRLRRALLPSWPTTLSTLTFLRTLEDIPRRTKVQLHWIRARVKTRARTLYPFYPLRMTPHDLCRPPCHRIRRSPFSGHFIEKDVYRVIF